MRELLNRLKFRQMSVIAFVLFSVMVFSQANAQERVTITGKVLDTEGTPIEGATILVKGTNQGVTSHENGDYTLPNVSIGSTLEIQLIGFVTVEKKVENGNPINVIMMEDAESLDEVTVVAFGTQKKESVLASITTVSPRQLKTPSSNLTAAFSGRMAGMISYQRSGEPGADNAEFFVRGVTTFGYNRDPLILIDNIELSSTDLARLQPDDIESFSIMKDAAATALYGARGANGVILVKTREGQKGKARLNLRVENTWSMPTKEIKLADPVTYMKMHNEAIATRDPLGIPMYSDLMVENTVPGSGSMVFPSTDWKKTLLKNNAMNQRVNLSINGGGDVARYYVAASFSQDNGILNVDKNNNFNSNIDLKVYTLRSNINIDVTKSTELKVSMSGTFEDYTGPISSGADMYGLIMKSNPALFPAKYPVDDDHRFVKHTMFGNAEDGKYLNPYAEMVRGYKETGRANIAAQMELKQKLNFITEGLSLRGLFNTTRISGYSLARQYDPFYYKLDSYDYLTEEYKIDMINRDAGTEYLGYAPGNKDIIYTTYMEGSLNYDRKFGKHATSGLMVLQLRNKTEPNSSTTDVLSSLPYRNFGLSGRFSYGYDDRYLIEMNFGYNGSERFDKKNRFGFFPSASAGWIVSNEEFFKPAKDIVSMLKFRASYGLVGNDNISSARFLYISNINMNDGGVGSSFGWEENTYPDIRNGISVKRYADPDITWEIAAKANYAIELTLFKDLNIVAEYYTENRKNILQERLSIPFSMGLWGVNGEAGTEKPRANLGKAKGHGTDISIDYSKSFGDFWTQVRGNFTYATSKYTEYEDYDYRTEWWKLKTGNPTTQKYGYIAEGLFVDDAEVRNSPTQFGDYKAGDIKYRDLNGDGLISDRDMAPIGYPTTPEIVYGFGASLGYKNWDFSFFFNGNERVSFWMDYRKISPFHNTTNYASFAGGKYSGRTGHNALSQFIADSYWSEENRDGYAVWPRLSASNITNNEQTNTWFMRNGAFLRLKQIEFGYSLPEKLIGRIGLKTFRVYATANNVLSFSRFKLWDAEMAGNGLGYPIQRTFNLGINLTF